jgi:hypothetical protein
MPRSGESVSFSLEVLPSIAGPFTPTAVTRTFGEENTSNNNTLDPTTVFGSSALYPPVANAGEYLLVRSGDTVILDGTRSYDPEGESLSFAWSQIAGPRSDPESEFAMSTSIIAPQISQPAILGYQLTVTDGIYSSVSSVSFDVLPCTFAITSQPSRFSPSGGSGTLSITTQPNCIWNARASVPWIMFKSGSSGTGSAEVEYSVSANPAFSERSGELIVDTVKSSITQQAYTVASEGLFFPQVATGGGYSTSFLLVNSGAEEFGGELTLLDQQGVLLDTQFDGIGSDILLLENPLPILIPAGGTRVFRTIPTDPTADVVSGWANVRGTGGILDGMAIFQRMEDGDLAAHVGVLPCSPVQHAAIQVDSDDGQELYTGFAIANIGDADINVRLLTFDENGTLVDSVFPPDLNPLPARHQVAVFLHQLLPARIRFDGTMVLAVQGGMRAVVIGLMQHQGLLSAIPVASVDPSMIEP